MTEPTFLDDPAHTTAAELLAREHAAGRAARFTSVDAITTNLLTRALAGEPVVKVVVGERGTPKSDTVQVLGLTQTDRQLIEDVFDLSRQQTRGAWFLPEDATLRVGPCNLPAYLRHHPGHAMTLASEDVARVRFASGAESLMVSTLLIPVFEALMEPVTLRAQGLPADPEEREAAWRRVHDTYTGLGVDEATLAGLQPGGGWAQLDRTGHQARRLALLDALARADLVAVARRCRARRVAALTAAFAKKSRRGTPLARQVLTRAVQPTLVAYFGGDWLAYLDYLGAPPNPDESITTALPEPRLVVGSPSSAKRIADEEGLPVDEVQAMLAAYMGASTAESPVLERVRTLTRWWHEFDAAHARQRPGMTPLWGLVDEGIYVPGNPRAATPRLYRNLLSPDLVSEVDRLWDGRILPRWPERIVSEPHPHKLMAETFGPALTFWHGVALTAWFVCEGPYSRTTLDRLRDYHRRQLLALDTAGTPVSDTLFDDLARADRELLGPPEQRYRHSETTDFVTISYGGWVHRDGFAAVRDVITRHRRAWGDAHLDTYLRQRWDYELRAVTREFHRTVAAKGKPPTLKAFARLAAGAVNHWFGGDLSGLYAAMGEKSPATPARIDLLPVDAHEFVAAVYDALGGEPFDDDLARTDHPRYMRLWALSKLAAASVYFLQAQEALGRAPDEREFGAGRHDWPWPGGQDEGWPLYRQTVERLSRQPASSFRPSRVVAAPRSSVGPDRMVPATAPITPTAATPVAVPPPRRSAANAEAPGGRPGLLSRLLRRRQ